MDPLFANMFANAGRVVLGALAVAGGFLIGNVLTLLLLRVLAKFMWKQRLNETLEKAIRFIGGLALAILVAFLVFRGGSGWGLGGDGDGQGTGQGGEGKVDDNPGKEKVNPAKKVEPKPSDPKVVEVTEVRVTILSAKEFPNSFLFEGAKAAVDLEGAKKTLRELREQSNGKLRLLDLLIYKDSTAESNPIVLELEEHAHLLGLNTARKKIDRKLSE